MEKKKVVKERKSERKVKVENEKETEKRDIEKR